MFATDYRIAIAITKPKTLPKLCTPLMQINFIENSINAVKFLRRTRLSHCPLMHLLIGAPSQELKQQC